MAPVQTPPHHHRESRAAWFHRMSPYPSVLNLLPLYLPFNLPIERALIAFSTSGHFTHRFARLEA